MSLGLRQTAEAESSQEDPHRRRHPVRPLRAQVPQHRPQVGRRISVI